MLTYEKSSRQRKWSDVENKCASAGTEAAQWEAVRQSMNALVCGFLRPFECPFDVLEVIQEFHFNHDQLTNPMIPIHLRTPLINACHYGYSQAVQTILEIQPVDPNRDTEECLFAAAKNGRAQIIKMLLEADAKQVATSCRRKPGGPKGYALLVAAMRGDVEVVEVLLSHVHSNNIDVDATPHKLYPTALFAACANGRKVVVELLIDANADVNRLRGLDGATPLMTASQNGHADIVNILLERGAKMKRTAKGLYSLICAALYGHIEVVKLLYRHMADNHGAHGAADILRSGLLAPVVGGVRLAGRRCTWRVWAGTTMW